MTGAVAIAEIWRGGFLECVHAGHAVICDSDGKVVRSWGNPDLTILPRSSAKMIQALPLVESGAADRAGLSEARLALACASHIAAPVHNQMVEDWLGDLGLDEAALLCGPQAPRDTALRHAMICRNEAPCRIHNNCSGKHCGFLTLAADLGAGPDYVDPDHAVQRAIRAAFEDLTGQESPGFGIDGCSAPNFATTLTGMARAMGRMAGAGAGRSDRDRAALRLTQAMSNNPVLVAGEGMPCTEIMRALGHGAVAKTGADGFYIAILPELGLGIALKIVDGADRAQNLAIVALLVHLGLIAPDHPVAEKWMRPEIRNFAGLLVGEMRPAEGFPV